MSSQPSAAPAASSSGLDFPQILMLTCAAVCVGPFAIGAGALLATVLEQRRRWLWVTALPSVGAAVLLWPLMHRHLLATAKAIHRVHAHLDPERLIGAAWPHLWPTWAAATAIAPLIALLLAYRNRDSLTDLQQKQRERDRTTTRVQQKITKRAVSERDRTADGDALFLGYTLGGDNVLPTRKGRASLPLPQLAHHLLVTGATGSGKTETVLRIAYSLAATSDWKIIYLDGKGDRPTMERFAGLMTHAGREVTLFPDRRYDGWRGSPGEIANRLLCLIDFAEEGGGTYYRDIAVNAIRLACETPTGPPRSTRELLRRLNATALTQLHHGTPTAAQAARFRPADLDGVQARYAAFFATVGTVLDGDIGFEQIDTGYFLLDGLRLKYEAGYLARFLIEEFTQWAVGRKPRDQRVLLVVDEFSAIATAGTGLIDVVERARGFGVAAALCPQVAEGMGGEEAAARIIGSTHTILMHKTALPTLLADVAGTRQVYEVAHQLDQQQLTGLGSTRLQHQYRVNLDEVRRLRVGQCFAITPGRAMKVQVAPAPALADLHTPASPEPVGV